MIARYKKESIYIQNLMKGQGSLELAMEILWGAKCVKNDVKQPIYISLPHIYIERDIYISGVIFIYYMGRIYIYRPDLYIWPRFIYVALIYICTLVI